MKTLFARAFTLFAFALGLGAYAASVGDTYSSTTAGSTTASTQGGWGEYDTWTLSIPATAELPAGTVIRIDSIKLGSRYNPHSNGNDKNAANAADASAALNEGETRILEVNGVKSAQVTDYTGTLVAGINNDNGSVTVGELTYTFSGLEVVVGASYTVKGYTADGATMKLRTRLVNKANYSGDVCVFGEVQANWYPVYAISGEVTGQYDYVALVDENTNFSNLSWVGGKDFSEATDESSVAVLVSAGTVTIDQDIDVGTLVISGGAVAVDGTHTVKATDGAIASPITIADGQTLKTGGTLRLTGANRISWGGTLEVADGSTSFNAAGTGINGTLKIDTDATLLSLASDAYNYNASSDTFLIVEGTLDMGSTRWSMGTRNTVTLAGGEITGTGEATNGAFDSMGPLTVTEDSTISAAIIRVRGNSSITVDANKTLTISGLVKRDNGDQGITKNGEGTLLLTGTQGDYAFVRVNGGKVVYDGVSPAASSTIEISGTGWVELQNLSNFYPAITGNGNIRVPTYALATSLNGAGFTGTVKVAGDDTTTTLEPIAPNLGAATTLDLTDFTALETINFNIGTRRTLCNIAVAEGVSPKLDYLTFRETLEDDGVLEIAIPSCFSSVEHVILYNADDVPTNITSSDLTDGTLTVEFPVSTKGKICWLDYEFDNDGHPKSDTETVSNPAHAYVPSTGSNATPLYFYNRTEVPENIYVADDEVDGNYFIKTTATPYGGCSFPETWTAAIRCSVPVTPKALIVSFGTQGGGCVGLAAGSAANEVVLARTTGNSAFDPAATMKVAKAATVQHLYVFVKTATTIKVYCDGSLVNTYTDGNGISFGNGFQIGSVNGSIGNTGFAQLDD
ncbi:MAG: hypothetical protein IJ802_00145, partial [Kiritimatiellae bacterium]|nr:hypothetical protein [Kiritimatiellia bacterium]